MSIITISAELTYIFAAINAAGGKGYLVGGCVRDALLGFDSKDIDIEVYSLDYEGLLSILDTFGKVDTVGKSFGVIKLTTEDEDYDFTFPRRDNKTGEGYTGFTIEVDSSMSLEEAASRRDFTFNALMYDPLTGELIDVFGGQEHLQQGLIVAPTEKFKEDPLRVLRGMQFAARFNLAVDLSTAEMMESLINEYAALSKDRVWGEWYKWATKSTVPSKGIQLLQDSGWLTLYPELAAMGAVPQEPKWHPEGDVLLHTSLVCDAVANICQREDISGEDKAVLMFAGLCHDMAKPATTIKVEGVIKSPGHEKAGKEPTEAFLASIGCPQRIIDKVVPLVMRHLAHLSCQTPKAVRRLAEVIYPATIQELCWVIEADQSGRPPIAAHIPEEAKAMLALANESDCKAGKVVPFVGGKHLIQAGVKPGPKMGEFLRAIFDAQLEGTITSLEEGLQWFNNNLA
jgi:tRNA nucleotidyltransferase (CCA-adding enzyme)